MNLKVNGLNVLNSQKPKINNAFIAFKAQPDEFVKNNSDIENREFIDRKIEELKNNAELIQKKSICIDKKSCDAEFLIGTQEGSNPGAYVVLKRNNDPDNNLYYAKFSNGLFERTKAEVLASKIYKLADINAADMKKFISYSDKKSGLISKYIPNQTSVFSSNKLVNKGFAMDAFLANWDAVCSNNVLTDGKKATRIDFGGCFD